MKYYAIQNYFGFLFDIAVFETREERDQWVAYQDTESVSFGYSKESYAERWAVPRKGEVDYWLRRKGIRHEQDDINHRITIVRVSDYMINQRRLMTGTG